jgi:hypothetical protein
MAWSVPLTAVANSALTAAQFNASVRDNLNETAAAKATTAGSIFAGTGVNALAERFITDNIVDTSETTTSTTYADLATNGPLVTTTTGVQAMVFAVCQLSNSGAGSSAASYEISGATSSAASDSRAILIDGGSSTQPRYGVSQLIATTPGSNTFKMKYRVTSGTGTFIKRRICIMGL